METDKLVLLIQQHSERIGSYISDAHVLATFVPNDHRELPIPRIGEKISIPHEQTGQDVYYTVKDIIYSGQKNQQGTTDLRSYVISGVIVCVEPASKQA